MSLEKIRRFLLHPLRRELLGAIALVGLAIAARPWWDPTPEFRMDPETVLPDPLLSGRRVDLADADEAALLAIPGMRDDVAAAILADRLDNGPLRDGADLRRVRGLGRSLQDDIAPFVVLTGGPLDRSPDPLDPNRASAADLERLPGVGPALAGRIVADRERRGPFRSVDDLGRVKGIGDSLLDRIRDGVAITEDGQ